MLRKRGRIVLVPFIIGCMALTQTGCGDSSAQEGATGGAANGAGAQFITRNADSTDDSGGQPLPEEQSAGTSGTDAAALQEETESSSSSSARDLTSEQCRELEEYINREDSYGFLLSSYEEPQDIDADQVFYIGAGIGAYELSEEETAAVEAAEKETGAAEENNSAAVAETGSGAETGSSVTSESSAENGSTELGSAGRMSASDDGASDADTSDDESTDIAAEEDADAAGADNFINLLRLTREQIEDLLQYKAGISLEDLTRQPESWIYLKEYDSYYINRGDEDTNLTTFEVIGGSQKGDYYTIHYREQRLSKPMDAFNVPVYEAVLKKNGDAYRFCSNRLWIQRNLLADASFEVNLNPLGDVTLCAYRPDTSVDAGADVTFTIVRDGRALFSLPGVAHDNVRSGAVFKSVEDVGFGDFNGDGFTDIAVICSYSYDEGDSTARADGLEARLYDGTEEGHFVYNRGGSIRLNNGVGIMNYTSLRAYMNGNPLEESYDSWQEAYKASVQADDPKDYSGYALLYIDEDSTPELLKMGNTEAAGARILTFYNGTLREKRLSRSFSYLEKENLLLNTRGIYDFYSEEIYGISGGSMNVIQSGSYGVTNSAVADRDEDGNPIYTYEWEGADLSWAGYRDSISFIYDTTRAVSSDSIALQKAGQIEKAIDELE